MTIYYSKGLGEDKIKELETEFALKFPNDYREFLQKYNCLYIDDCNLDYDGVDNGFISFEALLGSGVQNETFDLEFINDEILADLDFIENALVIGSDPGGNFFLLITAGDYEGVYYWDRTHLHADDQKKDYYFEEVNESGNIYKLDRRFGNFLDQILKVAKSKRMEMLLSDEL